MPLQVEGISITIHFLVRFLKKEIKRRARRVVLLNWADPKKNRKMHLKTIVYLHNRILILKCLFFPIKYDKITVGRGHEIS